MSAINAMPLLAGKTVVGSKADDAVATAVIYPPDQTTVYVLGVSADYSTTVSSIKELTIYEGDVDTPTVPSTTLLAGFQWDFTNGPLALPLPGVIRATQGYAVGVSLPASGTGGVTGRVILYYFTS